MKRIIMAALVTITALLQAGACAYAAPDRTAYAEVKVEALPNPGPDWVASLRVDQVYAPEGATPRISVRQEADGVGEIGFMVDLPGDYRFRVEPDASLPMWNDYAGQACMVDLSVFDTKVDGLNAVPLVYREGSDSKLEKIEFTSLTYGHYWDEEYETEYESETEIEEGAEGSKKGNEAGGTSTGNNAATSGTQASGTQQGAGTDDAAGGKASISAANAKTGDGTNIAAYVVLMALSIACIVAVWKRRHINEG